MSATGWNRPTPERPKAVCNIIRSAAVRRAFFCASAPPKAAPFRSAKHIYRAQNQTAFSFNRLALQAVSERKCSPKSPRAHLYTHSKRSKGGQQTPSALDISFLSITAASASCRTYVIQRDFPQSRHAIAQSATALFSDAGAQSQVSSKRTRLIRHT